MDLQGELNRLANIPASERMRGAAGCANLWAGTTNLELVGALNAKLGRAVNGTCLELNGVLKQLGFDLDSNGALVGVDTAGVVGGGGAGVQNVLRLPGVVGNFVSTPDTAALSISGDIDLRAKAALDNWLLPTSGSGSQTFISKENPSNQRSYSFSVTSGVLFLRVSVDGTTASTSTSSSASVSFAPGQTGWVRATWRQSDGRVQFFTSTDGVTYTQLGIDRTIAVASIFDGTGLLTLGTRGDTGQNDIWGGYLYYAEVRSGIGGPVVAKFDSTTVAVRGDRLPTTHTQPSTAEAIRLPGVDGNYLSTPSTAANTVTGDIDIRVHLDDDDTSTVSKGIIGKFVNTNRGYYLRHDTVTANRLNLVWSTDGTAVVSITSSSNTPANTKWVRVTLVVSTGQVTFYTSTDGITWTLLSAPAAAGATTIFPSTAALEIGRDTSNTGRALAGAIYYAEVRSGINGTVVASFDAARTQPTAQQLPTTQDLWTINGTAWSWDVPITEPSSGALRLPGVSGNYVTTPDAADISITGDIDVRAKLAADDWTPGTFNVGRFMGKWATGQRAWYFTINTSGSLQFGWSTDGINSLSANSSASPAVADGGVIWLRATRNVTTGDVTFYTSPDGITYTQLGTVQTSTPASMIDTTALLEVGSTDSGGNAFQGYLYRAEVYSGIAGTLVAYFDSASAATDTNRTPTTVVQSGRTWTLNGSLWEWVNVPAPTPWTVNGSAWYWGTYSGTTRFLNALQLDPQYVVFDGTAGNYASTPDSAALSITGDIDLRAKVSIDNILSGLQVLVAKYDSTTSQRSYMLRIEADGQLAIWTSSDGATGGSLTRPVTGYANGSTIWLRGTRVAATGVATLYSSLDGVTWNQLGATGVIQAGSAIFDGTALAQIGARESGATERLIGKVYYTEIRNGIGGSVVGQFNPHTTAVTAIRTPTTMTAFSGSGEVWTMNGSAWSWSPTSSPIVTTPDSVALSIAGDIDLRAQVTLADWQAVPGQIFIDKRVGNTGYQFRMTGGGTFQFIWGDGAVTNFKSSTAAVPFTAGQKGWVRVVLDVDNGAVGNDVKFYTSTDGITWTQLGTTVTTAAVTSIADGAGALGVGVNSGGSIRMMGLIHYAEIRNGIAGTVVGSFDPQKIRYTGSDTTPTTVPSATGEVYTITGSGWHWVQV